MNRLRQIAVLALLAGFGALATGCATHIGPYRAKHRAFDAGEYADAAQSKSGSLYRRHARGLIEDDRASRIGDVVIIQIDESDSGLRTGNTKLDSKQSTTLGITGALATIASKIPGLDLKNLFGSGTDFGFQGQGAIERRGKLNATLPVRVREVLPNDDLYIEGTKVVMVGNEEHHLYVSGIVRPVDIRTDGSVPSSKIADAEIEYTGRGDVTDKQRPGWFTRVLSKVWPF